jgi:hypothetical protein
MRGCGRGISNILVSAHGADVQCVEGSHDAAERTLLPILRNHLVEHDFSQWSLRPEHTYDAAPSGIFGAREFTAHSNYVTTSFVKPRLCIDESLVDGITSKCIPRMDSKYEL